MGHERLKLVVAALVYAEAEARGVAGAETAARAAAALDSARRDLARRPAAQPGRMQ
jgi:hypothetical protein